MKAMVLKEITSLDENPKPLKMTKLPDPVPKEKEILIKVSTCGVCHTELDEIEGRTTPTKFPIVLGHQVIGTVAKNGSGASRFSIGDRVGVAWIFSACGKCKFCREGNENLCKDFKATGRDANGGYAEYMTISEDFAYPIPSVFSDMDAAPLLCAGAVGYRSLRLTDLKNGQNLGFTGFGASGHLVISLARHKFPDSKMYVFARSGDERKFAKELGAIWTGDTAQESPEKLDAIIDTTPVWKPIVEGMKNLQPGGRLVINAIRKLEVDKKELMRLDYATHLWLEKEIKSVANVARKDVDECLNLSAEIPLKPEYQEFPLEKANEALMELHQSKIRGAKVLRIS
jgi:propanol-preferring alcohol dehydrogenase